MSLKELWFKERKRRKAAGEKMPVTEALPWTDNDYRQLEILRDCRAIGTKLSGIIRGLRADGKPFNEEADLLMDVKRMCDSQFKAWQPTPRQRGRAN